MKKEVLSRYHRDSEEIVIIDVASRKIEDLYSNFDRTAPYLKKDLDEDFAEYLIECVNEIGNNDFMIRLDLEEPADDSNKDRVMKSISSYFLYMREIEKRGLKDMFRTSAITAGVGFIILGGAIWMKRSFPFSTSVIVEIANEGLTIAAWVALWESLANLLLKLRPHLRKIHGYERIAHAPVLFSNVK